MDLLWVYIIGRDNIMKKIWKYIVGIFTLLSGFVSIFLATNKKAKKVKEIKDKVKKVETKIKNKQKKVDAIEKSMKSKKKALEEIKNTKFKKKDISVKDASDFLKKYSKKKKK